jgi:nicotinamide mononucleotide transporter
VNAAWQAIREGFVAATWLDQVNLTLGILGVALMVRRSLWAFPVGLVAVSVQGVLFWRAGFYADAKVQGFFFVSFAYGWWHWATAKGAAPELPIQRLSWRSWLGYAGGALIGTVLWAELNRRFTDAPMPYRDAFVASFSVAAQLLQARKQIANWPLWIVVNIVAVSAYWQADLAYTALLYLVYLGLAFVGWADWARALRAQDMARRAEGAHP